MFSRLNLEIHKGDKVALIGSNGAGKSTMMKLLVGLLKPSSGDILLNEKSIGDLKPEALSRQISMVYQNPEDMFIKDSIGGRYCLCHGGAPRTRQCEAHRRAVGALPAEGTEKPGWAPSCLAARCAGQALAIGVALNPGYFASG